MAVALRRPAAKPQRAALLQLAARPIHDLIDPNVFDLAVVENLDPAVPRILFHQCGVLLPRRNDLIRQPFIRHLCLTSLVPLLHLGMIFIGTPYGQNPQIMVTDGIGGSPYGPGTLAGPDGSRQPVESELQTARNLGSRAARVSALTRVLRQPQSS